MQEQIINRTLTLKGIEDYAKSFKEYDFSDNTADELEELYSALDMAANQADETSYAIACFRDMVDGLRVERAHKEEEADYESESEHREYLNSWWNSTRI